MKPSPECLRCILNTRLREIEYSSLSPFEKVVLGKNILSTLIRDFSLDSAELTHLASRLFELVAESAPDVLDYYRLVKAKSMQRALSIAGVHQEYIKGKNELEQLRYLLKLSALGNLIDYGVAEHDFNEEITSQIVEGAEVAIDDTLLFYELVRNGGVRIMYLLDNAGEAVYDSLVASYLRSRGNIVIGVVKDEPGFQNDVTLGDLISVGLDRFFDNVVTPGCNRICSSIHLDAVGKEFLDMLNSMDIVVAKGMAHFEYLSETSIGKPVLHVLIPKCAPVARALGSHLYKGKPVIYLRRNQYVAR